MENQENANSTVHVSEASVKYLFETAKWAKFLAIVGFISLALLILIGLITSLLLGNIMEEMAPEIASFGFIGLFYIILAAIFVFPTWYLYQFSIKMIRALSGAGQVEFENALLNQKSLFKFMGIYTIVMLALYVLLFVGVFVGAFIAADLFAAI